MDQLAVPSSEVVSSHNVAANSIRWVDYSRRSIWLGSNDVEAFVIKSSLSVGSRYDQGFLWLFRKPLERLDERMWCQYRNSILC